MAPRNPRHKFVTWRKQIILMKNEAETNSSVTEAISPTQYRKGSEAYRTTSEGVLNWNCLLENTLACTPFHVLITDIAWQTKKKTCSFLCVVSMFFTYHCFDIFSFHSSVIASMTPGILLTPLLRWGIFCEESPNIKSPFHGPGGWDFDFENGKPYCYELLPNSTTFAEVDNHSHHLLRAKAKVKPKVHHVCKQNLEQRKNRFNSENDNAAFIMASSSPSIEVISD